MLYESSDYLAHFGIKGMRWGIRRFQNEDGTLTAAGKKRYADDAVEGKDSKKLLEKARSEQGESSDSSSRSWGRETTNLSNQELRERLNRLQMETQYKRMMNDLYGDPERQQNQNQNQNNQQRKKEHPILKQVFVATATTAAASIVSNYLNNKITTARDQNAKALFEKNGVVTQNFVDALKRESNAKTFMKTLGMNASSGAKAAKSAAKAATESVAESTKKAAESAAEYVGKHAANVVKEAAKSYVGDHSHKGRAATKKLLKNLGKMSLDTLGLKG